MDASKLYKTLLFFTNIFGLSLDYPNTWRGNLKRFYAYCVIFSNVLSSVTLLHFLIFADHSLEEFSDAFGGLLAVSENFVKLVLFYKWRLKLKKLLHNMEKKIYSGNSISPQRFDKITKIGKTLTKIYLTCAVMTTESNLIGAFYKMYLKSERFLPFPVR